MGGKLPPLCPECREDALQMRTDIIANINTQEFKQSREIYRGTIEEGIAVYILEKARQIRRSASMLWRMT